jgi:hypothetical protein
LLDKRVDLRRRNLSAYNALVPQVNALVQLRKSLLRPLRVGDNDGTVRENWR